MNTQTETQTEKPNRTRKVVGRQDNQGQEAVIDSSVIADREDELIALRNKATEASEDYSTAIKKAAEDSGYNAGTVKKFIEAKASDKFDETKKKVTQLALIFDVE